jgi:hypothetical protein
MDEGAVRSATEAERQWTRGGVRALPPGGVVGGPAADVVPEQRPGVAGVRRANPVGGVIGPTTGRESEGLFGAPVGGGARAGQERRRPRDRDYDSNEQWPTPKGVPPVLEPGPEPVHDPGPILGPH